MTTGKTFAAKLTRLREEAGFTVAEAAKEIGMSRAALYNLENGTSLSADWVTIQNLADLYGVSTEDLRTVDKPA